MAIQLKLDYSKKLGLPQYSSHQFSVSLSSEVTDAGQIHAEVEKLYAVLQDAVDTQIVKTGYMPGDAKPAASVTGRAPVAPSAVAESDAWACSEKQRDLILSLVDRHQLDKSAVEELAKERFGAGVRQLNKLQASGLLDELLDRVGETKPRFASLSKPTAPRRQGVYTQRRAA